MPTRRSNLTRSIDHHNGIKILMNDRIQGIRDRNPRGRCSDPGQRAETLHAYSYEGRGSGGTHLEKPLRRRRRCRRRFPSNCARVARSGLRGRNGRASRRPPCLPHAAVSPRSLRPRKSKWAPTGWTPGPRATAGTRAEGGGASVDFATVGARGTVAA